jgi:hypothetical protein
MMTMAQSPDHKTLNGFLMGKVLFIIVESSSVRKHAGLVQLHHLQIKKERKVLDLKADLPGGFVCHSHPGQPCVADVEAERIPTGKKIAHLIR